MYRGRVIWNRHHWIRSAADSSKRRCVQNPQSVWIIKQDARLQIVSEALWQAVKQLQSERAHAVGERVKQGLARQAAACTGPGPRYLFSTLITCGQCGANFVMVDATRFGCSSHKHGGRAACANDFRVQQPLLEDGLLDGIRRELLSPEAIEEFRRRVARRLTEQSRKPEGQSERLAEIEREVENLIDAIARGVLRTSPALAGRLAQAEAEKAALLEANVPPPLAKAERLLPRVVDGYRELVADLPNALKRDPGRARASIRRLLGGQITIEVDAEEARFITQKGRTEAAFLRAVGVNSGPQTTLVAGVGFEPTTFGL
jgi:site-specific DNA recombinase